jgi:2-polyprenyl-6-methoxyphenol hydroxylase-like FAD-dependent oxidoreductase
MGELLGDTVIVIGAGMGGLTAAAALSEFFSRVTLLDRDEWPAHHPAHRPSIPQGRHVHALLGGGLRALEQLFPGVGDDLGSHGAVRCQTGLDIRYDRPGFDPFPQRDLGWHIFAMSRPLIEFVVRSRVMRLSNVALRSRCNVLEIVPTSDLGAAAGVRFEDMNGVTELLTADFIIDASARGVPTLTFLEACRFPLPHETSIGVDISYATATFTIPADAPPDWKVVLVHPDPRVNSHGGLMAPLEGGRWILSVGAAHGDKPPNDHDGFMRYVGQLRTRTIYDAICHAERVGNIERFAFPASVRRHFEKLQAFPRGLLPIADVICRFNPMYGQGMSVASIEAVELKRLLGELDTQADDPLSGLAPAFFAATSLLIDTPWDVANLDFVYPKTRGARPEGFEGTLKFLSALNRLAARDPAVHKLMMEVQHLLRPNTVYREPEFMRQIAAEMALP